jgi:hypothetical protein
LYIVIPSHVGGNTELTLISSNGSADYTIPVIGAGIVETVIWEDFMELSWNAIAVPKANFGDPKPGDRLRFYFSHLGGDPKIKLYYGDWGGPIIIDDPNFVAGDDLLLIPAGSSYYEFVLTAEMINRIQNPEWGSDGMLFMGQEVTIFKISILSGTAPGEEVIWTGDFDVAGWGNWLNMYPSDFENARVGQLWVFICDVNFSDGWAMLDIQHDGWSQFASVSAGGGGLQELEIEITQTMLDYMLAGPIHISGANVKIRKIALKSK